MVEYYIHDKHNTLYMKQNDQVYAKNLNYPKTDFIEMKLHTMTVNEYLYNKRKLSEIECIIYDLPLD